MQRALWICLAVLVTAGCNGRARPTLASDSGTEGVDGGAPGCDTAALEARAVQFCRAQFPDRPSAGQLGADCTTDSQCTSSQCLMPFGGFEQYCTTPCPIGTECPIGYSCQDTGTSWGSVCYRSVCIYGGADAADCVTNVLRELEASCRTGCGPRGSAWLDCLIGEGLICDSSQADEACGIERGLLESCCIECSTTSW